MTIADEAAISALRNALWYESKLRNDLLINQPATLEDALHRAVHFIEVYEEFAALEKKYTSTKVASSKEKPKNEYREPRQQ